MKPNNEKIEILILKWKRKNKTRTLEQEEKADMAVVEALENIWKEREEMGCH